MKQRQVQKVSQSDHFGQTFLTNLSDEQTKPQTPIDTNPLKNSEVVRFLKMQKNASVYKLSLKDQRNSKSKSQKQLQSSIKTFHSTQISDNCKDTKDFYKTHQTDPPPRYSDASQIDQIVIQKEKKQNPTQSKAATAIPQKFRLKKNPSIERKVKLQGNQPKNKSVESDEEDFKESAKQNQEDERMEVQNIITSERNCLKNVEYFRTTLKKGRNQFSSPLKKINQNELNPKLQPLKEYILSPNIEEYRQIYENSEKMEQYKELYKLEPNINQNNLLPKSLSLIQLDSLTQPSKINAKRISSKLYFQVLNQGMGSNSFKELRSLNLSENQMKDKDLDQMSRYWPFSLQELDLSRNSLTKYSMKCMLNFLNDKQSNLKHLNLARNNLGDEGTIRLMQGLENNKFLTRLNLNANQITNIAVNQVYIYIKKVFLKKQLTFFQSNFLQEIYLSYNQIGPQGGYQLFKAIKKNQYIRVVDVSFNRLGQQQKHSAITQITKVLGRPHTELLHLDISHNNFTFEEAKLIQKALITNQYLYGFHFEGNVQRAAIDYRGFLIFREENENQQAEVVKKTQAKISKKNTIDLANEDSELDDIGFTSYVDDLQGHKKLLQQYESKSPPIIDYKQFYRNINSTKYIGQRRVEKPELFDICWICEGWSEVYFEYKRGISGQIHDEPLFIHLDFDQYIPILMIKGYDKFYCYCMCPPVKLINYFYSNPVTGQFTIAKDQKSVETSNSDPIKTERLKLPYGKRNILIERMHHLNQIATKSENKIIDSDRHYVPCIFTKPREEPREFNLDEGFAKQKIQFWTIDRSIFKDYQPDTNMIFNECFEYDWACANIAKYTKSESDLMSIKQILAEIYPYLFYCYQWGVSENQNYSLPCISLQTFTQILHKTRILDKKIIKNIDLEIHFLSANSLEDKQQSYKYILDKTLVRYQFIEIIIRLAHDQYIRTKQSTFLSDALNKLLKKDGLLTFIKTFENPQEWRDSRYWNRDCEKVLKFKAQMVRVLFDYISFFSQKKFIHSRWISVQDFVDFLCQSEIVPNYISEKEAYLIFIQSIQIQVEELKHIRHFQMHLIEFMEAIARIAEYLSPVNPYSSLSEVISMKQRNQQQLHIKLEILGLLFIFFHYNKHEIYKQYDLEGIEQPKIPERQYMQSATQISNQINIDFIESDSDSSYSLNSDISPSRKKLLQGHNKKQVLRLLERDEPVPQIKEVPQRKQTKAFTLNVQKVGFGKKAQAATQQLQQYEKQPNGVTFICCLLKLVETWHQSDETKSPKLKRNRTFEWFTEDHIIEDQ